MICERMSSAGEKGYRASCDAADGKKVVAPPDDPQLATIVEQAKREITEWSHRQGLRRSGPLSVIHRPAVNE